MTIFFYKIAIFSSIFMDTSMLKLYLIMKILEETTNRLWKSFAAFAIIAMLFFTIGCKDPVNNTPDTTKETTNLQLNEEQLGFISTTGTVRTHDSYPGYVNKFIENLGVGSNIKFAINSNKTGTVKMSLKYAFWGGTTEIRAAYIYLDGELVNENNPIYCNWTSKTGVNIWQETETIDVTVPQGDCFILITPVPEGINLPNVVYPASVATPPPAEERLSSGKLPNFDYLHVVSVTEGLVVKGTNNAVEYFSLDISSENENYGTVEILEGKENNAKDTNVRIKATPKEGYKFDCWIGTHPSNDAEQTIKMTSDVKVKARFIQADAEQDLNLIGFGACADLDGNIKYTLTGGSANSESVTVTSLTELEAALTSDEPKVIYIESLITTADEKSTSITAKSNKSLISNYGTGHIKNIEIKLNGENYIVKNLKFSEVEANMGTGNDALKIGGGKFVWIDHCEFYSDLSEDKDYYDGLLDITNGARNITVSNCYFHDHYKAILCGSGDGPSDAMNDVNIRITFHHNYFKNIGSRTPLLRYGKAHIFNNYWEADISDTSAVNARSNSEVFVEKNVFNGIQKAVGFYFETGTAKSGKWNVSGNIYGGASNDFAPTTSTTTWKPKYTWTAEDTTNLSTTIPANAGVISE